MKTVKQCIDIIFDEDSGLNDNTKKNYKKFINSLITDYYKISNAELKYEEDFTLCFNNLDLIKKKLDFRFKIKTIRNNCSFYININKQITLLTQENIDFINDIKNKNNKRTEEEEIKDNESIISETYDKDIQTDNQDNKFYEFFIKEKDTIKNKIEEYEKEIIILKQKLIFFDEYFNKFKDL